MNVNVATFGLFLTESYCTASEDLEYIAQVHMNHFYGTFFVISASDWGLTASILIHFHYMEKSR